MQDARLVLVGDGPSRELVSQEIERQRVGAQTELLGVRNDVAELLRCMDVFVLPSLAEGISNTILEAMASGIPVVATKVGGNVDLVLDGYTGALVAVDDPDAMASALARYAAQPALRRRHGEAGRARAEREFSLESMVAGYMALYDRLLGKQPPNSSSEPVPIHADQARA
jgi:glycosyltransferase involved in cell wall biosynthesis